MALEKLIEQPTGAIATYWKVTRIEIDIAKSEIAVNAEGYISKDASDTEMANLTDVWFHFPFALESINTDIVALMYEKIKLLNEWDDAKDIMEVSEK